MREFLKRVFFPDCAEKPRTSGRGDQAQSGKIVFGCAFVLIFFLLVVKIQGSQSSFISSIQFDIPHKQEWEIAPLGKNSQEAVNTILGQKFTYFAKGARCLAFLSEDDQYVIKFFKFRYYQPHWTVRYFPSIFPFDYFKKKKEHKVSLSTVLTGHKNAYEKDPAGTGVVFVHLNPKSCGLPHLLVEDKDGSAYTIDLNQTRFVLQRRGCELSDLLDQLLRNNEIDQATKALSQVIALYISQFRRGLYDLGRGLVRNNGFADGAPIHFDVGKLTIDERALDPAFQQQILKELVKNVENWLKKTHPEYCEVMIQALYEKIDATYESQSA